MKVKKDAIATLVHAIMIAGTVHAQTASPELVADNGAPIGLAPMVVNGAQASASPALPAATGPLVDTPRTIDVLSPEVYDAQGAQSLSDVLRNTPGITFFAGEGGSADKTGGDSFYLRGFDTSNSIFVDGVRDEGAAVHDTFDLAQVDVVKGPSGENGRGGTAGYVNLETKLPQASAFAEADFSEQPAVGGGRAGERATVDLNRPLAAAPVSGAAFRLNLMDQEEGVPGRRYAENNRWGLAPSLAFGLGGPTRAYLAYEHQFEHNLPDYGLPSTIVPGLVPEGSPSAYTPGVDPDTFYGFANFDHERVTADSVLARIERDLAPGLTASNQMRWGATDRWVEATSPSGSVTAAPAGEASLSHGIYQTANSIVSNQTSLDADFSTGPVSHHLAAGAELSRERADNPIWSVVPNGDPTPVYLVSLRDPDNFPAALSDYDPHPSGSGTDTRIDTGALYAFDTARIGRWELDGGLRLERYELDELSVTAASPAVGATTGAPATAGTPALGASRAQAAAAAAASELAAAETDLTGRAAIVFKPAPAGSLYLSYGTSVQPPGSSGATNTLSPSGASADNPALSPEQASDTELGLKWSFRRDRLLATAALFRSVNSGVPNADPVTGLVDQTSSQTVEGIELGVTGKITDAWLVLAGYSQMEPKVSAEIGSNAQGLTLPLLPRESGNLWTTCALRDGLALGAGLQFQGATERLQATNAPTATTFANEVPSYWIANAMVSWRLDSHLTLRLNADNLADRETIASLNNNGYRVNLGAPRSYLLTAEMKF
jgi:catecholate siderophore receptor